MDANGIDIFVYFVTKFKKAEKKFFNKKEKKHGTKNKKQRSAY